MTAIRLATSRYQASELILVSGLVPVGISVGRPKFPLGYTPVYMRELAPVGLLAIDDGVELIAATSHDWRRSAQRRCRSALQRSRQSAMHRGWCCSVTSRSANGSRRLVPAGAVVWLRGPPKASPVLAQHSHPNSRQRSIYDPSPTQDRKVG